jgi:hypothetical protein
MYQGIKPADQPEEKFHYTGKSSVSSGLRSAAVVLLTSSRTFRVDVHIASAGTVSVDMSVGLSPGCMGRAFLNTRSEMV